MRVEKFTRRSRRLVAVLLATLLFVPISKVPGQTLLHTVDNPVVQDGAWFGLALASLGDVDGDGAPDFAAGAPSQSVGENFGQGQVFVVSGALGTVLFTLDDPNPQASAFFGWAVAGMGDVNRDGIPDVAVGAPLQSVGASLGRVSVFSGRDGSWLFTVDNPAPNGEGLFGYAIATVGDLDGDGVRELAVGAPSQDVSGRLGQGRAFVFSGASGAPIHVLDDPIPQNFAFFGGALSRVNDINGDDVDDIAVGAPDQNVGLNSGQGQVFVFSGTDGVLLGALDNPTPQSGAAFGEALTMVGDIDRDGLADLAVGAPGQNQNGFFRAGRVFVFSGVGGPLRLTLDDPNPHLGTSFGRTLAAVGDFDGNGVADVAVGARDQDVGTKLGQGRVFIFSGADGAVLVTLDDPVAQSGANYGYDVVVVENAGGGERYLVVSAPFQNVDGRFAQGQVFVYSMPAAGDTTPPTLTVPGSVVEEATSPDGAVVNYPSPTATDNQDPAPVVNCSPASGSSFPLGASTVTCTASDRAGNGASAGFTVTVRDSTPPDTVIQFDRSVIDGEGRHLSPGDSTLSSAITIEFIGTDAVGVAGYHCSWDGGPYTPCTSPVSRSGLSAGTHSFTVRAQDGAGLTDPSPATFQWTILTKGQAVQELKDSVRSSELSRREQASLAAKLKQFTNDKAACGKLGAFLNHLAARERVGALTSAQAAPLRQQAESLRNSLGCRAKPAWFAHGGRR